MKISEVAEKYKITEDTLRYYEKEGLVSPVPKVNGRREYGEKELANVNFVVCMRNAGVSVETLKEYLNLLSCGDETYSKRRELLLRERAALLIKLENIKSAYERLCKKIEYLDGIEKEKKTK